MAEIWKVLPGKEPTRDEPFLKTAEEAIRILNLKPEHYLGKEKPRFGNQDHKDPRIFPEYIVARFYEDEAEKIGWKPGFYRNPDISPDDLDRILIAEMDS